MENQEKKQVEKQEDKIAEQKPATRKIIIETDGNSVSVTTAEVAGNLELKGILQTILNNIK